jgi:hypothetical protein
MNMDWIHIETKWHEMAQRLQRAQSQGQSQGQRPDAPRPDGGPAMPVDPISAGAAPDGLVLTNDAPPRAAA